MTSIYAEVIGDPIAHSKSPLIHNFWLRKLGIDAHYRACRVSPDELPTYFGQRAADDGWRGCNITIPHKRAALALIDDLDPMASSVGAVNTIVMNNGRLKGYNSDLAGFMAPLHPLLASAPALRFARLIGAGGAALAVARALHGAGFTLIAYNRTPASARERLGDLLIDDDLNRDISRLAERRRGGGNRDWFDGPDRFDLLVNATSLGMAGQPPLRIEFDQFPPSTIIYDLVYSPLETPLLRQARANGFRTIDGLSMLIGQAAVAFELFFSQPAPREHDAELRALLVA